jgi:hypothetical protein
VGEEVSGAGFETVRLKEGKFEDDGSVGKEGISQGSFQGVSSSF